MRSSAWGLLLAILLSGCASKEKGLVQAYLASTEKIHLYFSANLDPKDGMKSRLELLQQKQSEAQELQKALDKISPPLKASALHDAYNKSLKEWLALTPVIIERNLKGHGDEVDLNLAKQAADMQGDFDKAEDERAKLIRDYNLKPNSDGLISAP